MTKPQQFYAVAPPSSTIGCRHYVRRLLLLARTIEAGRLLDIGCGDGSVTLAVANAVGAREVVGVDISPQCVAAASARGVTAILLNIDEQNLPFASDAFDAVVCTEVLEHVFDPSHLLDEAYRVLRPAGLALISTPNLASWEARLSLLLGYQPHHIAASPRFKDLGKLLANNAEGPGDHIRVMTNRAFLRLLTLHRFTVLKAIGAQGHSAETQPWYVRLPFRVLNDFLCRWIALAEHSIVLLTKGPPEDGGDSLR